MGVSAAEKRRNDKREALHTDGARDFWVFSNRLYGLRESERLLQIKRGFSAQFFQAMRLTFDLPQDKAAALLNASASTFERRIREDQALDTVASERLDRIASVSHLAHEVFESQREAVRWMSTPNKALGGEAPILLCETEIGARQVRRVLHALEWGGAA